MMYSLYAFTKMFCYLQCSSVNSDNRETNNNFSGRIIHNKDSRSDANFNSLTLSLQSCDLSLKNCVSCVDRGSHGSGGKGSFGDKSLGGQMVNCQVKAGEECMPVTEEDGCESCMQGSYEGSEG